MNERRREHEKDSYGWVYAMADAMLKAREVGHE